MQELTPAPGTKQAPGFVKFLFSVSSGHLTCQRQDCSSPTEVEKFSKKKSRDPESPRLGLLTPIVLGLNMLKLGNTRQQGHTGSNLPEG